MTLTDKMNAVRAFHELMRVSQTQLRSEELIPTTTKLQLVNLQVVLRDYATVLEKGGHINGLAGLRVHLITEELAELIRAILVGDEVEMLDALADLEYVITGTAVAYDLPLDQAFVEVHQSNMTKEKQPDDPSAQRVRSKGPNYIPPDIEGILYAYRNP